jgi:hypothetical protein
MKIAFDEIVLPGVLCAGTQNSSNFLILGGVLDYSVVFPPLTLKMTVKVIYFQSQNIKSE